ncbi:hypothetical protein [Flavobacterium sp. XS2P14]
MFLNGLLQIVKDPMTILLLVASTIYFISGKTSDGIFLAAAIILIAIISSYQKARSHNALEKLKDYIKPFPNYRLNLKIDCFKSCFIIAF